MSPLRFFPGCVAFALGFFLATVYAAAPAAPPTGTAPALATRKIRVLILDGFSNHN